MARYSYYGWRPYVPVAERRRQAVAKVARMRKGGREVSPVEIAGRKIATTFWGDAWCKNLEAYSDYSNRLPRGRTYVRNGSVIDLQIDKGRVRSLVSGSTIYEVDVRIKTLPKKNWGDIKKRCSGGIGSLVELLRGSIAKSVMEIVSRKGEGLFPSPREISLRCSCPDWAVMCKHVAATLYGVGARFDHEPEMLFSLRGVDPAEMVDAAVTQSPKTAGSRRYRVLKTDELSSVFGIDIDMDGLPEQEAPPAKRSRRGSSTKKKRKRSTATRKPAPRDKAGKKKPAVHAEASKKKPATRKKVAKKPTSSTNTTTKRAGKRKTGEPEKRIVKKARKKRAAK